MKKTLSITLFSPLPQLSPKSNSFSLQPNLFTKALSNSSNQLIRLNYEERELREEKEEYFREECEIMKKNINQMITKVDTLSEILHKEENSIAKCASSAEKMIARIKGVK
ncbi:Hypothetical_protein [Hexamita inflata]|uniref:Hypothetical_protein n=1 Tax=Hexamita inflata TaxID=28002 RepID=A0AA86QSP3_9EUKA|nr:Hypothetical protein HINF_LOCUS52954 [Hexamita inflata]